MTGAVLWTPARTATMVTLFEAGRSSVEMAAEMAEPGFNPTPLAIRSRWQKLGMRRMGDDISATRSKLNEDRSSWTEERVALLTDLHTKGHSLRDIAKRLLLSPNAIMGKAKRLGLKTSAERAGESQRLSNAGRNARPNGAAPVQTRVTGNGRQSYASAPDQPFEPLRTIADVSHARPWITRKTFECTWIVVEDGADSLACCAPIARGSWCFAHAEIGFVPPKTTAKDYARGLRRYAA